MFASMSAAFDGLIDHMQQFISGLEAISRLQAVPRTVRRFRGGSKERDALYPPAVHPVEGMHPVTGRKVLFVNPQFTVAIKNFTHEDSTAELYSKLISRSIFGFELAIDAILSRSSVERRTGGSIAQCIDKLCLVRGARGVGGRRCKATCDPRRL